mmetsp:Transcript_37875/g.61697  ORF Transcript_37875/g.61697 Transcript_37875/m.61697 type:complete len:83 (+) Transcript_37875:71-319(+)
MVGMEATPLPLALVNGTPRRRIIPPLPPAQWSVFAERKESWWRLNTGSEIREQGNCTAHPVADHIHEMRYADKGLQGEGLKF